MFPDPVAPPPNPVAPPPNPDPQPPIPVAPSPIPVPPSSNPVTLFPDLVTPPPNPVPPPPNPVTQNKQLQFISNANARTTLGKGRLRRFSFSSPFQAYVISPSGNRVGLFKEKEYWIWNTSPPNLTPNPTPIPPLLLDPPLVCAGHFKQGGCYHYGTDISQQRTRQDHKCHTLSTFHCAALSDKFIAISTGAQVLVFEGSGQCLFYIEPENTFVSHLMFSPDGTELLALAKTKVNTKSEERALIAPRSKFVTNGQVDNNIPRIEDYFKEVGNWGNSVYRPHCLAFSSDGKRIAICTTNSSDGFCEIRLLQLDKGLWKQNGQQKIDVGKPVPGFGNLTGIQL